MTEADDNDVVLVEFNGIPPFHYELNDAKFSKTQEGAKDEEKDSGLYLAIFVRSLIYTTDRLYGVINIAAGQYDASSEGGPRLECEFFFTSTFAKKEFTDSDKRQLSDLIAAGPYRAFKSLFASFIDLSKTDLPPLPDVPRGIVWEKETHSFEELISDIDSEG